MTQSQISRLGLTKDGFHYVLVQSGSDFEVHPAYQQKVVAATHEEAGWSDDGKERLMGWLAAEGFTATP